MRFTIRDLLWLTVVVALAVCWWLDHGRLAQRIEKLEIEVNTDTTNLGGDIDLSQATSPNR